MGKKAFMDSPPPYCPLSMAFIFSLVLYNQPPKWKIPVQKQSFFNATLRRPGGGGAAEYTMHMRRGRGGWILTIRKKKKLSEFTTNFSWINLSFTEILCSLKLVCVFADDRLIYNGAYSVKFRPLSILMHIYRSAWRERKDMC